jgi:hypothetical protein
MDILEKFWTEAPRHAVLPLWATDPVTESRDVAFILTESPELVVVAPHSGVMVGLAPAGR